MNSTFNLGLKEKYSLQNMISEIEGRQISEIELQEFLSGYEEYLEVTRKDISSVSEE